LDTDPARFLVIDRRTGDLRATLEADPFFAFHHINAYEQGDSIILDVSAYDDHSIIDGLYLERLRSVDDYPASTGQFRRYTLPLNASRADYETVVPQGIELPRINYRRHNGHAYNVAYGISIAPGQSDFPNALVRVDVSAGDARLWHEDGTYPSEPVFVAAPDASREDDGVLLSVVLDTARGTSFLLVLDAADLSELARATVPQHVPFHFHGQFFRQ